MVQTLPAAASQNKPKLLDQVRDVTRRKHFSIRTEQTYVDWIKRYICFTANDIQAKWPRRKSPRCSRSSRSRDVLASTRGRVRHPRRTLLDHARTGTLAVRSSLPQLTQAPLMARRIAFQTQ